ncbi:hypothetical protein B0H19DRAFT_1371335 [Mycena capillaripes]|nr:hypothetical protein B0H19DRAFT_1371335 [Mycena capillaripes]
MLCSHTITEFSGRPGLPIACDAEEDGPAESAWTAGDTVGKILAFVKPVRILPQAREFFKKCCGQVALSPLELLLWARTRWASLYKALERALELRKAIDRFVLIADSSDKVQPLKDKNYMDYMLTPAEWERLRMIHEALRVILCSVDECVG